MTLNKKNLNIRGIISCSIVILYFGAFQSPEVIAQCSLIDPIRDSVFITFEKTISDAESEQVALLRVRNNSTCSVIITTGSAEKFYEPLPPKPTAKQVIHRKINYELPDSVLVPKVQYSYFVSGEERNSVGGDSFFGFTLLGRRSILFEVPLEHFSSDSSGRILLEFDYEWERENRARFNYPSVTHTVRFSGMDIPRKKGSYEMESPL